MPITALERHIRLDGVFNFRDLGGYPTVDGRTTRWRTLFRADGLDQLTDADLETLRPLDLRTVVDLRTPGEIAERGRFPVEQYPVRFHNLSIIDQTWNNDDLLSKHDLPAEEFLYLAYMKMGRDGRTRFAAAFEVLAAAETLPAVFHCAAGKDRTGLLAALVLGAIGVDPQVIVDDYALTQAIMPRFIASMTERYPERAAKMSMVPAGFLVADPAAMARVLKEIERLHGSIRGLVHHIGVPASTVATLEDLLLEG